jgi:DNA-binding response OmpR family regulator
MSRARLLVVDDEPDIRDMIRNHFELREYQVSTAKDGAEGLDVAGRERPDVVIMDVKMPSLDGDQLLERLHAVIPGSKFIVLTAYQDDRIRDRVARIGCHAYLEKPASMKELQKVVESLTPSRG